MSRSSQVTVTSAGQSFGGKGWGSVTVRNAGPNTVYLSPTAGVTTATGFGIPANTTETLNVASGGLLYGVCAAAETATVHVWEA
jgi:hypothetical protein